MSPETYLKNLIAGMTLGSRIPLHSSELEMLLYFLKVQNERILDMTLDYKNDDHYQGWLDFRDECAKIIDTK